MMGLSAHGLELSGSAQAAVRSARVSFETTEEVEPLEETIGQPRPLEAGRSWFGLQIDSLGYNLYVPGAPGPGRETTVRYYVDRHARESSVADDWVYVHSFDDRATGEPGGKPDSRSSGRNARGRWPRRSTWSGGRRPMRTDTASRS